MNRDVIYIDVEDDITAIIGKIKASKDKIIALVPPKRAGVLQSAVNLRLLDRMAKNSDKKLVIVTHNPALVALSAAAKIPVARNLQSKPEVAELAEKVDEEETIIDGAKLPVGDHVKMSEPLVKVHDGTSVDDAVEDIDAHELTQPIDEDLKQEKKKPKIKVPDFGSFRKKFFLAIIGGIALIAFLVWANMFAPAAKIIISASTSNGNISSTVTIAENLATDSSKDQLKIVSKQLIKKEMSVEFTATGIKENKATGSIVFRNCQSSSSKTIPAGTIVIDGSGLNYVTASDVTVPGGTFDAGCTAAGVSSAVVITAAKGGSQYNNASTGVNMSVDKYAASMTARTTTALTGGDSTTTTVVSADDILKAKEKLAALTTDSYKTELVSQFGSDYVAIPDSMDIKREDATSVPALNEVATTAKLTSLTTFTMYGASNVELGTYLDGKLNAQIAKQNHFKIYNNGLDTVKLTNFYKGDASMSVSLSTKSGKVGPIIDEATVKELAKGQRYGEVQNALKDINGINSVDVQFSYFWVSTVPSDNSKIQVEFIIDNGK